MLGGRRGLADGGWAATSVAEVLPAQLPMLDGPSFVREPAKAELTELGKRSAVTRLERTTRRTPSSGARCPSSPTSSTWASSNPAPRRCSKPTSRAARSRCSSNQRYGLGNAYMLATGGTWRWQMQLPHEDQRHETFWRQLLQALATSAPQPVTLTADRVFYGDESTVKLRAEVRDKRSSSRPSDANVNVEVSDGLGPPTDARDDAGRRRARRVRGELRDGAPGHLPLRSDGERRRRRARQRAVRGAPRGRRHRALPHATESPAARATRGGDGWQLFRGRGRRQAARSRELLRCRQCRATGAGPVEHADRVSCCCCCSKPANGCCASTGDDCERVRAAALASRRARRRRAAPPRGPTSTT